MAGTTLQPSMRTQQTSMTNSIFADAKSKKRHYRETSLEPSPSQAKFESKRRPYHIEQVQNARDQPNFEPDEKFFTPKLEETPFQPRIYN